MTSLHPEQAIDRGNAAVDLGAQRVGDISQADVPGLLACGQLRDPGTVAQLVLLAGADAELPSRSPAARSPAAPSPAARSSGAS